jgi:Phage integrase family
MVRIFGGLRPSGSRWVDAKENHAFKRRRSFLRRCDGQPRVKQALQQAVRWNLLARNPADARTVALAASVVEELRAHRVRQAQELIKLGIRLSDDSFVVAQADGSPLQPRSLTHAFELFLAAHKLPRIRLHDLRHTNATAMLKAGVHGKIGAGTPRAFHHRHHIGYLQPGRGWHAGGGGRAR